MFNQLDQAIFISDRMTVVQHTFQTTVTVPTSTRYSDTGVKQTVGPCGSSLLGRERRYLYEYEYTGKSSEFTHPRRTPGLSGRLRFLIYNPSNKTPSTEEIIYCYEYDFLCAFFLSEQTTAIERSRTPATPLGERHSVERNRDNSTNSPQR